MKPVFGRFPRSWILLRDLIGGSCLSLCLAGVLPLVMAKPAPAAERVTLTYGFAEISTSVEALQVYADSGEVNEELAPYLDFLNEEQRSQFRAALQVKHDISPVELSQFIYSSIGDNILRSLGDIVRTQSRLNGAQGLRGALVLAAAEPGGLSVLGVLKQFPTQTVRIDSQQVFKAINGFSSLLEDTQIALTAIEQQAVNLEAASAPLPDFAQSGAYGVTMQTLTMVDGDRDRELTVDLYLPEPLGESSALSPVPLVIASHGLAGDRKGFRVIGEHLASHGFAVAALDHPGSDYDQFLALLAGRADEIAEPTEFSERPRDISYLLDELTRLNAPNTSLANRLDMQRVGIIGHSFGGYTALAVAGAQLDFETLKANCDSTEFIFNAANTSMLLQCTALEAPEQFTATLRDERIRSVMAMNPVTSSLFGSRGFTQIAVPSLLVAGSADPIAPALLEQIQPFIWLSEAQPAITEAADAQPANPQSANPQSANPHPANPQSANSQVDASQHYLALIKGGSHLYELPVLENADVSFANSFATPDIALTNTYLKVLSLGFMQMTLTNNAEYLDDLMGTPILQIGQQTLPLYVINSLTEEMLLPVPEPVEGIIPEIDENMSPETPPAESGL